MQIITCYQNSPLWARCLIISSAAGVIIIGGVLLLKGLKKGSKPAHEAGPIYTLDEAGNVIGDSESGVSNDGEQASPNLTMGMDEKLLSAEMKRIHDELVNELRQKYPHGYAIFGKPLGREFLEPYREDGVIDAKWDQVKCHIGPNQDSVYVDIPGGFLDPPDAAKKDWSTYTMMPLEKGLRIAIPDSLGPDGGLYMEILDPHTPILSIGRSSKPL